MMISYGMDGFAYAMEAMVGKAIGAKDRAQLNASLIGTFFWSLIICLGLTAVFGLAGSHLIAMITSIEAVQQQAAVYLPWLVVMPLASMWCFLFDGIFVGATSKVKVKTCETVCSWRLAASLQSSFCSLAGKTMHYGLR